MIIIKIFLCAYRCRFYEPIKDSLKFFENKMKKGGIIVMDDYGFNGTPVQLLQLILL